MNKRRSSIFHTLSEALAYLSDSQVQQYFQLSDTSQGWGVNHVLKLKNQKVFVKRIPLTALEYENAYATHNLFCLPMFYHYGVGSAGFGAYRELLCHIKSSHWVMQGLSQAFPLLYHYRIMPATAKWKQRSPESLKRHLQFWNQDQNIATYLRLRAQAPYELVLFLEYFPMSLHEYFSSDNSQIKKLLQHADQALQFMNHRGLLHLDAHLANLLTDGQQVYISDFGLALDRDFILAADEQEFLQKHQGYDRAELMSSLNHLLLMALDGQSEAEKQQMYQILNIDNESPYVEKLEALLNGLLSEKQSLQSFQTQHLELCQWSKAHAQPLIQMAHFYTELRDNPQKDTPWPEVYFPEL